MQPAPHLSQPLDRARQFLLAARNADGGWPYVPGKPSSPEPTCHALMALTAVPQNGLRWLLACQNADGAIVLPGDNEPHWSTSLAALAMATLNTAEIPKTRAIRWLLATEGRRLDAPGPVQLNGSLRGWPWISETFSWVEPTAYALLALKCCGQRDHPRVAEAQQLLLNRVCQDGGWNYGNTTVYAEPLPAFLPTTAMAALALQDVEAARPAIVAGMDLLAHETQQHRSALALAWAVLCFNAFRRPSDPLVAALLARQETDGSWRQQVHLTALATLALQAAADGTNPFSIFHVRAS